jgi:hypothetical protein
VTAASEHAENLAWVRAEIGCIEQFIWYSKHRLAALTHIEGALVRHSPRAGDTRTRPRCRCSRWLNLCPEYRDAITHLKALQ